MFSFAAKPLSCFVKAGKKSREAPEEASLHRDRARNSNLYICTFLSFYILNQHRIRRVTRKHWCPSTFLQRNVGLSGFFWSLRFTLLISWNFSMGYTAFPSFSFDSQMILVSGFIVCEIVFNGDTQRGFVPLNTTNDLTKKCMISLAS